MEPTVPEVQAHIEDTRRALGANLNELEQKVESALDWRLYVRRQPWPSLALAFGAGYILSGFFAGRARRPLRLVPGGRRERADDHGSRHAAWEAAKATLMGLATAAASNALERVAMRAHEHFDRTDATVVMPGSGDQPEM